MALAEHEFITLGSNRAAASSLDADINGDGLTGQNAGRIVELREPNVTLEDGSVQTVRTKYHFNQFGQLVAEIDPEGNIDTYGYHPENMPSGDTGQPTTPDPPGRVLDGTTGGYLAIMARDTSGANATTEYVYDNVGNVVALEDERGIRHEFVVNERNQVQISHRATDTTNLNPEEPRSTLAALDYETRNYYDGNDNLVRAETENVVDEGNGNHQPVSGNPWLESDYVYDLLDNLVEETQEVSEGETRTIRGYTFDVGPAESITTQFRYDRNENPVLTRSPLAVDGSEPHNMTSAIYDERDLVWKSTRGGVDGQFGTLPANAHIIPIPGAGPDVSTVRTIYDGNRNVITTIDAEDNGSPHDGSISGLDDTDDPSLPGIQRGDPTFTLYDGFDRVLAVTDAMGYQSSTGCGCGGSELAYDPDGNVLARSSVGPAIGNVRGGGPDDRLLNRSRSYYDELSREYRTERDYFRDPQPLNAPVVEAVYASHTLFDASSRATRQTRPLGDFLEYEYDGLDRVIVQRTNEMTGAAGTLVPSEVHYRYNDTSNLVQIKELERSVEDGRTETYYRDIFYDAVGRNELEVSNHFGNLDANATRREYDSRGNLVARLDANASTTEPLTVDRDGALTLDVNATGNATITTHDGLNRAIQVDRELRIDHDGANSLDFSNDRINDGLITTRQDWDANSRLVSFSDDTDTSSSAWPTNPSITRYSYDDLNRRTQQINADVTEVLATSYDRDDHRRTFTDANGSTLTDTLDDLGRTVEINIQRGMGVQGTTRQAFEYDGLSRIVRATDNNLSSANSEVTRMYDSLSRIRRDEQIVAGISQPIDLEYDRNSNLIQIGYSEEAVVGQGRRTVTYGYQDSQGHTLPRSIQRRN